MKSNRIFHFIISSLIFPLILNSCKPTDANNINDATPVFHPTKIKYSQHTDTSTAVIVYDVDKKIKEITVTMNPSISRFDGIGIFKSTFSYSPSIVTSTNTIFISEDKTWYYSGKDTIFYNTVGDITNFKQTCYFLHQIRLSDYSNPLIIEKVISNSNYLKGRKILITTQTKPFGIINSDSILYVVDTLGDKNSLLKEEGDDISVIQRYASFSGNFNSLNFEEKTPIFNFIKGQKSLPELIYNYTKNRDGSRELTSITEIVWQTDAQKRPIEAKYFWSDKNGQNKNLRKVITFEY